MLTRILFAGGCHIDDSGPYKGITFATVALRELQERGFACESDTLVQVRLSHPRRLAQRCSKSAPDILVLQAGHPETMDVFRDLRKRFNLPVQSDMAAYAESSSRPVTAPTFVETVKLHLRERLKLWVDAATGHTLMDIPKTTASVDAFFGRIAELGVGSVIILSPLPCRDRVTMYYRVQLAEIFRGAAARLGFEFIDLTGFRDKSLYLDWHHLNEAGHRAIAQPVTERLLHVLENVSLTAER